MSVCSSAIVISVDVRFNSFKSFSISVLLTFSLVTRAMSLPDLKSTPRLKPLTPTNTAPTTITITENVAKNLVLEIKFTFLNGSTLIVSPLLRSGISFFETPMNKLGLLSKNFV